ncbi:MAG: hypothetical protein Q8942_03175 [Bacillota bacterium]|nr:hypothetical protein [Bacillota bacterium]
MADDRNVGACGLGGLFGNDVILWFIILFLLLFWCGGFAGGVI